MDAAFAKSSTRDLSLMQQPALFRATLPFQNVKPQKAFTQNKISSSLTRHWTNTLRGQRY